ncbi:MAG: hypothetical protein V1793_07910 [Pseudomonadota bacterium]
MKNSLIIIPAVLVFTLLVTNVYAACLTGDCENGKGVMTFPDRTEYTGDFKDGQPNGMGTFIYPKGKNLETGKPFDSAGQTWVQGYPMGEKYVGEVKAGKRHGYGVLEYEENNHTYKGYFKDDMFNGKGIMVNPNGVIYEGDFSDNQPNGVGKVTFPDGRIYEGDVQKNKFHGKGVMIYPDGKRQEGMFEDGKYMGEAKK